MRNAFGLKEKKYIKRKLHYWTNQGIQTPVDGIWSVIKGIYNIRYKPVHLLVTEQYEKYGRVYGTYMGFKPQISIADPDILKRILVKDFNMFHNRMKFKSGNKLFDKMLSLLEDDDWKRIRCIMSPTFSSGKIRKMAYLVKECAEKFSENLKKIADENKTQSVDCKSYLNCFAIDVIASTAFGTKLSSLDDPNNEFVTMARKATNIDTPIWALLLILFPKLSILIKVDVFAETFNFFKNFTLHVIDRREKEKTKSNDFLQLLLDAQKGSLEISPEDANEDDYDKEQSNFKMLPKHKTMSSEEMMAQCAMILFGGSDTTTNTLSFVLYHLALNPECQDKFIQEVDDVWSNNEDINFDVLSKTIYLDAVINETLRLNSVAIQLVRECTEEYELPELGIKIPKGMNVIIPVYAMHRDKEFFPNPEKFDPDRFMPENKNSIPQYAYLPFGEGPRNCIGMRFAFMTLKMCLVYIFRDIRVEATEETKRMETGSPLFDKSLFMVQDEDWKRIRCIVSPTFSSGKMRKMSYLIKECAEKFSENLKKIAEENENNSIDCKKYLSCFTIDVIASTAFGTKLCSLEDPNSEFVVMSRKATNKDVTFSDMILMLFPALTKFVKITSFEESLNYYKNFILHVINKREKEKLKAYDFLQLLLDAQKGVLEVSPEEAKEEEMSNFKILPKHKTMSSDEMMAQCTLFLFAGNETTTNTVAFVLYHMALYPEHQDKLLREVDEIWKTNGEMNFDVLNKMQYMDAVINETLRKQPALLQFLPENRNTIIPFTYLPFGEGPRNCVGMRFALMVVKMCLVYIFRDLRVEATEETKLTVEQLCDGVKPVYSFYMDYTYWKCIAVMHHSTHIIDLEYYKKYGRIHGYMNCFTIDVMASAAFGTKLCCLEDPNNEFLTMARKATNRDISFSEMILFLFPILTKLIKVKSIDESFSYYKNFILHVIDQREKEKMKAYDFLQLLLDAQKGVLEISPEEANEEEMSNLKILPKHKTMNSEEMMAQCTGFLFAGNETTTNALAFVLYHMALYPEYQNKLIEEVDKIWKTNDEMTFDVLNKMQYMDAVINETLRKTPALIQLFRECTEEYELPELGIKIPKGMNIVVPIYAMHHDKEFFPNPEKFDPDRFLPENRSSIIPFTYLPFGEGPRNCIGMRFALMVIKMCLVYIFRDLRVEATEETKLPLEYFAGQGILNPKKVMIKFEKRK
ncbi:uncharacterized protein LOC111621525 [Centruroides sculpturatus]|uniref:uncharacterized protein LOC111621525 n=1 Tax=Centruroides sculpturatus TaxID=218467 RepID=UPI000C6CA100|nr:uncharacterized protein LOC111621525 [Centruroides sculpturatus]